METATSGRCCMCFAFTRSTLVLTRTRSPSRSIQIGVRWGVPSLRSVASWARALPWNRSSNSVGITANIVAAMTDGDAVRHLELGLILPTWTTVPMRWQEVLDIAKEAEAAGFDALWVSDHVLLPSTNAELRKRAGATVRPDAIAEPEGYFEAFSVLAALAPSIPRLQLGTLVACTGYRNPFLLAKIADNVDAIGGGGRVRGRGAADSAGEHETMGLPTDSPVGRFEEALQVVRTLLRDGHLDHSGPFYTVRDAVLVPRGPRPTGPPILIGTLNPRPRMRRIVAQYADVWNGWLGYTDASAEAGKRQADQILEACAEHGRDPSTLVRTVAVRVNVPGSGYLPAP